MKLNSLTLVIVVAVAALLVPGCRGPVGGWGSSQVVQNFNFQVHGDNNVVTITDDAWADEGGLGQGATIPIKNRGQGQVEEEQNEVEDVEESGEPSAFNDETSSTGGGVLKCPVDPGRHEDVLLRGHSDYTGPRTLSDMEDPGPIAVAGEEFD